VTRPGPPTPRGTGPVPEEPGAGAEVGEGSTLDLPTPVIGAGVGALSASCPRYEELEMMAAGGERSASLPGVVLDHIKGCERCRALVEEILENNRFLAGVGGDLTDASATGPMFADPEPEPEVGVDEVPGYRIEGPIHRGAQGVVYRATQLRTGRVVAIKMLAWGATVRQRARLEREAEIAAGLKHPNIVTVYDAMALAAGRVAIVMEYVEGVPLDEAPGTAHERLRMFVSVCEAVHFAHERGVIHRDLKPANVLVDAEGQPRVVDFGIAKQEGLSGPVTTMSGEFSGTLAYASPEQVRSEPGGVTLASDVYSLGVMLCELVTGEFPYAVSGSVFEIAKRVMEQQPVVATNWKKDCGGGEVEADLRTIILRALDKEPGKRYASARELGVDLSRFLTGEAIAARRDSSWYVLRKLAKKHRVAVSLAAGVIVLVSGSAVAMGMMYRIASRARDTEAAARGQLASEAVERNLEQARLLSFQRSAPSAEDLAWREFAAAVREKRTPDVERARWTLRQIYRENPCMGTVKVGGPVVSLGWRAATSGGAGALVVGLGREIHELGPELELVSKRDLPGEAGVLRVISRDGSAALSVAEDGGVWLTRLPDGDSTPLAREQGPTALAISDDGSLVALGRADSQVVVLRSDGTEVVTLSGHVAAVRGLSFSHDGKKLATIEGSSVLRTWGLPEGTMEWFAFNAMSREKGDGRALAAVSVTGPAYSIVGPTVTRFQGPANQLGFSPRPMGNSLVGVLSPDERVLALGTDSACTVPVWNTASGVLSHSLSGHRAPVRAVAFDAEGWRLYSGDDEGFVKLWNHEAREVPGLKKEMTSVAVGDDGTAFMGGVSGTVVKLESGRTAPELMAGTMTPEPEARPSLTARARGGVVASVTAGAVVGGGRLEPGVLAVWATGESGGARRMDIRLPGDPVSWSLEAGGAWGLVVLADKTAHAVDLSNGSVTPVDAGGPAVAASSGGDTVFVLTASELRRVFYPSTQDGQTRVLLARRAEDAAWSAMAAGEDGRLVAIGSLDGKASLIEVATGDVAASIQERTGVKAVAVSEAGGLFAVGTGPVVRVYSTKGEMRASVERPELSVVSLAFTPGGESLVGCGSWFMMGYMGVWDLSRPDESIAGNAGEALRRIGEGSRDVSEAAMNMSGARGAARRVPGVQGRSFGAPVSPIGRE